MDLRPAASRVPVDRGIEAYMASHYTLIPIEHVLRLGGTRALTRERCHTGAWLTPHRGVFQDAAAPRSPEQRLLAAVFACGEHAEASHLSGTWVWGLLARPPDLPEVSVPYTRSVRH